MKRFFLTLLMTMAMPAFAQIGLKVTAPTKRNLEFKHFNIQVEVNNLSGNTLTFSPTDKKSSLYIQIFDKNGRPIYASNGTRPNLFSHRLLKPGDAMTMNYPITKDFPILLTKGTYTLTAMLKHKRLRTGYQSRPVKLHVDPGHEIYKRRVGMPSESQNEKIKERIYSVMLHEDDTSANYYLRLKDDKYVYKTLYLGPKFSLHTPSYALDSLNNLHVLLRIEPRLYKHICITAKGDELINQNYTSTPTPPVLRRIKSTGFIEVQGGSPALKGVNYDTVAQKGSSQKNLIEPATSNKSKSEPASIFQSKPKQKEQSPIFNK